MDIVGHILYKSNNISNYTYMIHIPCYMIICVYSSKVYIYIYMYHVYICIYKYIMNYKYDQFDILIYIYIHAYNTSLYIYIYTYVLQYDVTYCIQRRIYRPLRRGQVTRSEEALAGDHRGER